MKQFASLCQKGSDSLERFCLFGAGVLLVINLASVMLGVFGRFYRPPIWTLDLAKVTLVWMVMLAAAPALKRGEHMAITILVNMLPYRFRRFVKAIRTIVFFGVLALMLTLGSLYAIKMQVFTVMSLGISKTIPFLAIPIGMGLMMIEYALQQFIPLKNNSNCSSCENIAAREDLP
ncbi:TRAP transporter small permease [Desulfopila aestuarii]|uniref:TRAP-type C4-dicarboxylate transport system, small permease component n=1 Tax=Desulfopila aestuarii DSM 18488 TaxID=1121416 RepID=A0A1M7YLR5_9BACT|nr:TRAP transporter small permease [Desulfopila aestuarii]SHO53560.1 TRAP-type C4-dicarboxylate transport system, small permease component [Desulfopila aestuarii DSM 18488]